MENARVVVELEEHDAAARKRSMKAQKERGERRREILDMIALLEVSDDNEIE